MHYVYNLVRWNSGSWLWVQTRYLEPEPGQLDTDQNSTMATESGIALSSATRSGPLGYVGCQILWFLSHMVVVTRWRTLGVLSIDIFCRVFLPFCYTRHSSIVLKVLLLLPWVVGLPRCVLSLFKIHTKHEFVVSVPGCACIWCQLQWIFPLYFPDMLRVCFSPGIWQCTAHCSLCNPLHQVQENSLSNMHSLSIQCTTRGGHQEAEQSNKDFCTDVWLSHSLFTQQW